MPPWLRWLLVLPATFATVVVANRVLGALQGIITGLFSMGWSANGSTNNLAGQIIYAVLTVAAPCYLCVYAGGRTAPSSHYRTGLALTGLMSVASVFFAGVMWTTDWATSTAVLGLLGCALGFGGMYLACLHLREYEATPAP